MDFELIFQITTYVISAGIGVYFYIKKCDTKKRQKRERGNWRNCLKKNRSFWAKDGQRDDYF